MRVCRVAILIGAAAVCVASAQDRNPGSTPFELEGSGPVAEFTEASQQSLYVAMNDGVRVAVDVVLPRNLPADRRLPAILKITRYGRSSADRSIHPLDRFFVSHGYARVLVDERGTGASFGTARYGPATLDDLRALVEWTIRQPWSNGRVGAIGNSYEGTTAELLAATGHPAVQAVVPRFSDFDYYRDLFLPGGVRTDWFVKTAAQFVRSLDSGAGAKPVDDDREGRLLEQAVAEHRANPDYLGGVDAITFVDDVVPGVGTTVERVSNASLRSELERARVPMLVWASWMDAGTADGALTRFRTLKAPQRVIIGPWNHGATRDANAFKPADRPVDPPQDVQWRESLRFFDRYLKAGSSAASEHRVHYYTVGEERWKSTAVWPPAGSIMTQWWLEAGHLLTIVPAWARRADDVLAKTTLGVSATSGTTTRWHTQMGGGDVIYVNEAATEVAQFTSDAIPAAWEITGHPVLRLRARLSHQDPTLFVYLHAVDRTGAAIYLTEGRLRALHRQGLGRRGRLEVDPPRYSFLRKDGAPVQPGEPLELQIALLPLSVNIPAGSRLRLTIAGADRDAFGTPSQAGPLDLTILGKSKLELPLVRADHASSR